MIQWIKMLATKPDDTKVTWLKLITNSYKCSNLHACIHTQANKCHLFKIQKENLPL